MKLGFDLDGVISDIVVTVINTFNNNFDKNLSINDIKTFNLINNEYDKDPEKNKEYALKIIEYINDPKIQLKAKPYNDAVNALRKIKNSGHSIHIITARYKETSDSTIKWLRTNKIPHDSVNFTGSNSNIKTSKLGFDKGMFGRSLNLDMYVDDFVDNLESMWKYKKRWRKGLLLLDKPWNCGYVDINKFKRVYNWDEILRYTGVQNR